MGRLPLHFTEEDVAGLVRRFGTILIIREKGTTRSEGLNWCISSVPGED